MRTKTAILAALLLAPALASPSGYEGINVSARNLALAGAAVAAQRDATATFFDPAALSRLSGLNLSLSGAVFAQDVRWRSPSGLDPADPLAHAAPVDTGWQPVAPVSLFGAYGLNFAGHGIGVGFGLSTAGGGDVRWPEGWVGAGRIVAVERRLDTFFLNAGYELLPQLLRIGGGLTYAHGTETVEQAVAPGALRALAVSGGGFGYQASAELTPVAAIPLTFAVDYKHQVKMDATGDARSNAPAGAPGPATTDQAMRTRLTSPNVLQVGVAYKPLRPLTIAGAWSFSRQRVDDADTFVGSSGLTIVVPRHSANGNVLRLGAEWQSLSWAARAGLLRDLSGVNRAQLSPALPDSDAWGCAVGGGWKLNPALSVDGALFYGRQDEITSASWSTATNLAGTFPATYASNVWIGSVGVTWRTDLGQ
jgi:long-chain fatty acid transport protein